MTESTETSRDKLVDEFAADLAEAEEMLKRAARVTDDYVHDNPWQAIGIAAAVGVLVGLLMNRR